MSFNFFGLYSSIFFYHRQYIILYHKYKIRLFVFSSIVLANPTGMRTAEVTHRSLWTYRQRCYSSRVENRRQLVQKIHLYLLLPQLWAYW